MPAGLKDEKKQLSAWLMYKEGIYTQNYIAQTVGTSPKTITQWKEKYQWEKKRKSLLVTKEAQLIRFYDQLDALNTQILTKGKGIPDNKQSDTQVKLTTSIKNLETETSLAEVSEVGKRFLKYINNNSPDHLKVAADLFNAFFLDYQKTIG